MKYLTTNLCLSILTTIAAGVWATTSTAKDDPSLNSNPYAAPRQDYRVEARTTELAPVGPAYTNSILRES